MTAQAFANEKPIYSEQPRGDIFNPDYIGIGYINALRNQAAKARADGLLIRLFRKAAAAIIRPQNPGRITYISDNGDFADLAKTQISHALSGIQQDLRSLGASRRFEVATGDIPSQDTAAAAYDLWATAQDANTGGYPSVVFVNCAPRKDETGTAGNNQGEQVFAGVTSNGTVLIGTGAHCFSMYKEQIERGEIEFFRVRVQTFDSQFRSRDFFPVLTAVLAQALPDRFARLFANPGKPPSVQQRRQILKSLRCVDFATPLRAESVPSLTEGDELRIARRDVHDNIKTAVRFSDLVAAEGAPATDRRLRYGDVVQVTINGVTVEAKVVRNMFELNHGEFGISSGSNGRNPSTPADPREGTVQIYQVGGKAAQVFGVGDAEIRAGAAIRITRDGKPIQINPCTAPGLAA